MSVGELDVDLVIDDSRLDDQVARALRRAAAAAQRPTQVEMRKVAAAARRTFMRELGGLTKDVGRLGKSLVPRGVARGFEHIAKSVRGMGEAYRTAAAHGSYAARILSINPRNSIAPLQAIERAFASLGGRVNTFRAGVQENMRLYRLAFQEGARGTAEISDELERLIRVRPGGAFAYFAHDLGRINKAIKPARDGLTRIRAAFLDGADGGNRLAQTTSRLGRSFGPLQLNLIAASSSLGKLTRGLKQALPSFDGVRNAMDRVRESAGRMGASWRLLRSVTRSTTKAIGPAAQKMGGVFQKVGQRISRSWSRMDSTVRLVITVLLASMGQVAVLTSAVGGSLAILGSGLMAAAAGAGVAVVGFQGLFSGTVELSSGAAAARDAFRELGTAFKDLQPGIVNSMFSSMAPSIENLTSRIPELSGALNGLAESVGGALADVFDQMGSDAGIAGIKAAIEPLGDIFASLVSAAHGFGAGLVNVFTIAAPLMQQFADAVATVGNNFLAWTQSEEGRARIQEWLNTAAVIMPKLGGLVSALGNALADLVTPETIGQLGGLIDSLTSFAPILGEILGVISHLNIFGLVAAALDAIGAAIQPLLPSLHQLAGIIGESLMTVLQTLGTALGTVVQAFAPIMQVIVTLVGQILPPLLAILMPIITTIATLAAQVLTALMPAFQALIPPIMGIINGLAPLAEIITTMLTTAITAIMPLITSLASTFVALMEDITPLIEAIMPVVIDLIQVAAEVINALIPVVAALIEPFLGVIDAIAPLIASVLPIVTSLLEVLSNIIRAVVIPVIKMLTPIISFLAGVLSDVLGGAVSFVTSLFQVIANFWKGTVQPVIDSLSRAFQNTLGKAIQKVSGFVEEAIEWFQGIWDKTKSVASFFTGTLVGAISGISDAISGVIGWIQDAISWFGSLFSAADSAESKGRSAASVGRGKANMASGGILTGPTRVLAGEAGREAFVPLDRPLSRIDASVRHIAAFAQGKMPRMASGGVVSGGGGVTFAAGSIVVRGAIDPRRTALETANRIAERVVA